MLDEGFGLVIGPADPPWSPRALSSCWKRAMSAVLTGRELLEPREFTDAPRTTHDTPVGTLADLVAATEREAIIEALKRATGNRREAAGSLGVSLRTLFYKIDRYGIS